MIFRTNGASGCVSGEGSVNVFALVIYVPDPLATFLDDLRRELVPHCNPRAHVSVLPPRPLAVEWSIASAQVRSLMEAWSPFEIELTDIRTFPATDVIYLELGDGSAELHRLHDAMDNQSLAFHEPFAYHPHVTLAQEVPQPRVASLFEMAAARWKEYAGPRRFRAERAVLVQNTLPDCWIDLAEYALGVAALK
jgi:2'-5' RNA ligase superfamily